MVCVCCYFCCIANTEAPCFQKLKKYATDAIAFITLELIPWQSTVKSVRYGAMKGTVKIGVMGAKGSFSEEAGRTYAAKAGLKKFSIEYLVSAENVLTHLEKASIDIGIFPIENSNGGIVLEAVHAMAAHRFKIKKIFEIDVHHNLLVKKGVTADKIKTITSHDQAIKQCRMYLKRRWPKVKIKEYMDTAKAAEDLAGGKLPSSTAVIAARAAAQVYKLDILEESIQDLKFNYTSFIAAERIK